MKIKLADYSIIRSCPSVYRSFVCCCESRGSLTLVSFRCWMHRCIGINSPLIGGRNLPWASVENLPENVGSKLVCNTLPAPAHGDGHDAEGNLHQATGQLDEVEAMDGMRRWGWIRIDESWIFSFLTDLVLFFFPICSWDFSWKQRPRGSCKQVIWFAVRLPVMRRWGFSDGLEVYEDSKWPWCQKLPYRYLQVNCKVPIYFGSAYAKVHMGSI